MNRGRTISTLGDLADAGAELHFSCHDPRCCQHYELDLVWLIERLGREQSYMEKDLRRAYSFQCNAPGCGSRSFGFFVVPSGHYDERKKDPEWTKSGS